MKYLLLLVISVLILSFSRNNGSIETDHSYDNLKINQLQVIASHNSYHLTTEPAIMRFLVSLHNMGMLPKELDPRQIDYTNVSLTEQFEKYGVRGLEIDVWNDPQGGNFYHRMARKFVWKGTASRIEALKKPGFKVLHIPDIDFRTTVLTFVDALTEIKKWSDAHPDHTPLYLNIETEVSAPGDIAHILKNFARAVPFDSAAADAIDKEIKSVFGDNLDGVITPDMVKGNYKTLEEAVLAGNWPKLGSARGKVIFIVDADGESGQVYAKGHPSLKDRVMFVYVKQGTPEAAFVEYNEPDVSQVEIQQAVKKGYMIRTRSDEGTIEARNNDYRRMNFAFSSWGQIISTDYYRPDSRAGKKHWSNYHVQFPGGVMVRVDSLAVK